jgi:hypothetical protein
MSYSQIQRLEQDSEELGHYVEKLLKRGRRSIAQKIKAKKQFLDNKIDMAKGELAA